VLTARTRLSTPPISNHSSGFLTFFLYFLKLLFFSFLFFSFLFFSFLFFSFLFFLYLLDLLDALDVGCRRLSSQTPQAPVGSERRRTTRRYRNAWTPRSSSPASSISTRWCRSRTRRRRRRRRRRTATPTPAPRLGQERGRQGASAGGGAGCARGRCTF